MKYKYKASCGDNQTQIEIKDGCHLKKTINTMKIHYHYNNCFIIEEERKLMKHKHAYCNIAYYEYACDRRTHIQKILCRF